MLGSRAAQCRCGLRSRGGPHQERRFTVIALDRRGREFYREIAGYDEAAIDELARSLASELERFLREIR
jgi:hypothetical protein